MNPLNPGPASPSLCSPPTGAGLRCANHRHVAEKIEYTDGDDTKVPDLLVVVHPAAITEKAQFAIDQYLLSGKNVVMLPRSF